MVINEQCLHKTTEDSQRLNIVDLGMYYVEKTKVLISGVVVMQLFCIFVLRICKKQIYFLMMQLKLLDNLSIF